MTHVEVKKVDAQGRISLPVDWRKSFLDRSQKVMVVKHENHLEIIPVGADLSKYIDSVDVDVKEWKDYHSLRKELRKYS